MDQPIQRGEGEESLQVRQLDVSFMGDISMFWEKDSTYSECFLQILAIDDPLSVDDGPLDEIMDIFQRVIKNWLWNLFVLFRPEAG